MTSYTRMLWQWRDGHVRGASQSDMYAEHIYVWTVARPANHTRVRGHNDYPWYTILTTLLGIYHYSLRPFAYKPWQTPYPIAKQWQPP